jgi:Semialdehyde dehydrogenase, NAD binding domain
LTTVLLDGLGAVGIRAARQLVDTPGIDTVLLASRRSARAGEIAEALGERAQVVEIGSDDAVPAGVDVVAAALPADAAVSLARRAIDTGVPFTSTIDDAGAIADLLDVDERARRGGALVAPSCGLAPGFADVLARHAAEALDVVDEVHIARAGVAGRACLASLRWARREPAMEWRDRDWHEERHGTAELVWFPDPIGARECAPVAAGIALLVRSLPSVVRATMRFGEPPPRRLAWPGRRGLDEDWGSTRVEVWGWRGKVRESMVYGVIDRTAVAAGTVLAVATARLAGVAPGLDARDGPAAGVHGLAALVEPVPFLAELARRGVKAAVFEGVRVA